MLRRMDVDFLTRERTLQFKLIWEINLCLEGYGYCEQQPYAG